MDSSLTFRAGIKDVIPTVFGYIGVGLAMGIVANTSPPISLGRSTHVTNRLCWFRTIYYRQYAPSR